MRAKIKYQKLDEVGFIGVQKKKRTSAEIQKEATDTARFIKALKVRKSRNAKTATVK